MDLDKPNIARVNSLNVDVRLLMKRTKLRRSLKESRLSLEFQDFSKSFPNLREAGFPKNWKDSSGTGGYTMSISSSDASSIFPLVE